MLGLVIYALYFFLPAYVANTSAGLFGDGRPLDFGRNFSDGRRLLGDGVTVRGFASGVFVGVLAGVVQGFLETRIMEKVFLAFLLSFGALAGDAAGSFIKRRVDKPRGSPLFPLDQLNFVVGGLFFASFIEVISLGAMAVLFILTPVGHLGVNKLGYHLKMKDVPW